MLAIYVLLTTLFFSFTSSFPADTATSPEHFFTDPDVPTLEDDYLANLFNLSIPAPNPSKRATRVKYSAYAITVDGRNTANWEPFFVYGNLIITQGIPSSGTLNGANPVEVLIAIGKPIVNPVAGALRYTTQRALYRLFSGAWSPAILDYAFVSVTSNGATIVTVDPARAAMNQASVFNARTGLTAHPWQVSSGGFKFTTYTSGALSGAVNLRGRGSIEPGNGRTPYIGVLKGKLSGSGTLTVG
jgi:hypothetical protein